MELENLLTSLKSKPSDTKQYLAIEISTASINMALWHVAGTKPEISKTIDPLAVDAKDEDGLTQAASNLFSQLTAELEEKPTEVIFGLPDEWVDETGIIAAHKKTLKTITEDLGTKAVGFVVTSEAILHGIKIEKGDAISTVLVGLDEEEISVHLVTNGSQVDKQVVVTSGDLCADIKEGLARFKDIESLPTNITIFSGMFDLGDIQTELNSCNWQEDLPFLHIPKIEAFNSQKTITNLVATGGSEFIKNLSVEGDQAPQTDQPAPATDQPTTADASDDFGFTTNQPLDAAEQDTEPAAEDDNLQQPPAEEPVAPDQPEEEPAAEPETKTKRRIGFALAAITSKIPFPKKKDKDFTTNTNQAKRPKKKLIAIILAVVAIILIVASAAAYWFLPKATVTVYLDPNVIEEEITLTIDPNTSTLDESSNTLPGRLVETQVDGSSQTVATGQILVGDKASGTVTMFNRTDSVKSFDAGTALTGPDSLTYTIDESITIASASASEDSDLRIVLEPSTVDIGATASSIGAQYNLGSGTEFSVANFDRSSFVARASTDITGGTSREITAVAQEDIDLLRTQVKSDLETKVRQELSQAPQDLLEVVILPYDDTALEETLSAEVDQEANDVTLNATLTVSTITYKKSDLAKIAQSKLSGQLPPDHQLEASQIETEAIETTINEDETVTVVTLVKASTVPQIDTTQIVDNITGRFPNLTESFFKNLPNFSKVEINITPALPNAIKTFPRIGNNITVVVETSN